MYDVGQRYGRIVVLSKELVAGTELHSTSYRIHVKCDCGNERYLFLRARTYDNKNYTSCGCVHFDKCRKDLKRKKFGKLTVGNYNEKTKSLRCVCECGNEISATSKDLLSGKVVSCGNC